MEMLKDDVNLLYRLTVRNIKIFVKDKAALFFSFMGPLIVLLLYILFLGQMQLSGLEEAIPQGIAVDKSLLKGFIDSWMIAGLLGYACITISLSANTIIVQDKANGVLNDVTIAPVKKWIITFSYFIYNFIITTIMVVLVLIICLVYLAISGGWYISVGDVFGILGTVVLSTLSATLITVMICNLLKTQAQHGAFMGIASSVIGFLIGAYMPISLMPKGAQYISAILPGSYSSGMFRTFLMRGSLDKLASQLPTQLIDAIKDSFVMEINMFGKMVGVGVMTLVLVGSIIVFFLANLFIAKLKK
ncbi:MAG: ABC transporter permease [Clostridia bacterium]